LYKTYSEVVEALNAAPNPAIVSKNYDGKSYISWDDAVAELNRIFGPFGWSTRAIAQSAHPQQGIYLAAIEVTVTIKADKGDATYTVTRAGFGRAVAQPDKDEQKEGILVSRKLIVHDTAASAAGSDALSKATKLLGKSFGLEFYAEARRARANGNASGGTFSGERSFSEKQVGFLKKLGWSDAQIAGMSYQQGKDIMDNRESNPSNGNPVQAATGGLPF
jgi:Rad52/22 family double-strand break repair protein